MVRPATVPAGHRRIAGAVLLGLGAVPAVRRGATGHVVPVFQRIDQAGFTLPLDERVLADTDTLLVFGLDHMVTEQEAAPEEIEAVRQFLKREGTCLVLGPHHDVGVSDDLKERDMEYHHHGDALVPRQQRFGGYTRALMKGLGVPVENRYGLRPARDPGTKKLAPLVIARDLDTKGWLKGVTTFNFHMHLPHYAVTTDDANSIHVLARQPIDLSRPHPFTEAGNREFNTFVWMPPRAIGRATCCWPTPRSSARCSAATRAWSASGGTSPRRSEALSRERTHDQRSERHARAGRHPERRPAPAAHSVRGDLHRVSASTTAERGGS